jgi:hypothetical protein
MNYLKVYCNLIRKAENRTPPEGYTEKHHTFPKSIFGKNDRIVILTGREHYIAHALLEKIYIKRCGIGNLKTKKMINAVICMKGNNKYYNSFLYEQSRKRFSYFMKNVPKSKEQREKMSKSSKRRYEDIKEREKVSIKMKEFHKNVDMSGKRNGRYGTGYFYEIISPEGEIGYTNRLELFCKENGLVRSAFCKILAFKQNYHKGWTIRRLEYKCTDTDAKYKIKMSEKTKEKLKLANTGKKHSNETKEKISKGNKGKTIDQEMRDRISNTLCKKTYKLISPAGEEIIIKNITKFCSENNLVLQTMSDVIKGKRIHYKGWTGQVLTDMV